MTETSEQKAESVLLCTLSTSRIIEDMGETLNVELIFYNKEDFWTSKDQER